MTPHTSPNGGPPPLLAEPRRCDRDPRHLQPELPRPAGRGLFRGIVISLYDYTGIAVRPWADAGFDCLCFDIQHSAVAARCEGFGAGSVTYIHADLHNRDTLADIAREYMGRCAFLMGFPVCTDLAVSGAAHFEAKRAANPLFQEVAADHAKWCAKVGDALGVPYVIENPVSVLSTLWRKPDHSFHPYEYGGYIPADQADHPTWPEYIAPRDAYPKKTCLWTGGGFEMPAKRPVDCPAGYSAQHKKLGGKSAKTKNIRSATPRGFFRAVFDANSNPVQADWLRMAV
jgi:hypothetical protein